MRHDVGCANDEGLSSFAFEMEMGDDDSDCDCSILACHSPFACRVGSESSYQCIAPGTAHSIGASPSSPSHSPTRSAALSQEIARTRSTDSYAVPTMTPSAELYAALHRDQMFDDDYKHDDAQSARAWSASTAAASGSSGYRTPPCRPVHQTTRVGNWR